jgi:hypothetical protein
VTDPAGDPSAYERISTDPGLRRVVEVARAWGVSPRRFLGWEPTRTIRYEQGLGSGAAVITTEPEWSDDDRDLAAGLLDYEAGLCPGCRHPLAETTMPEREFAYVAEPAVRCHRCTASAQASEVYAESPTASALLIPVELRLPTE